MISPKPKQCSSCNEYKVIWKNHEKNKYCKECWQKKNPTKLSGPKKRIKAVSDKKKPLDKQYSKLRKAFLEKPENNTCRAKLPGCFYSMNEDLTIHHTKGRGKYYLDDSTWIPLCLHCHMRVHEMGFEEASALGLMSKKD
jgi:hypothetical protein